MYYQISSKKITEASLEKWSRYIGIPKDSIKTRTSDRFRFDCFKFQISGKIFIEIFKRIITEVLEIDYSKHPSLRQAFLRGLFAAEGSVNINKQKNYLVYIGYHFSYAKEEKLAEFVQKLLKLENISSKSTLREKKGERYLQITSWENYSKCWRIGLFDLSKRKKDAFMWKLKQIKSSCHVSNDIKVALFKT